MYKYVYVYVYVYMYIYIYVYVYMYMYICICIYVYVYISTCHHFSSARWLPSWNLKQPTGPDNELSRETLALPCLTQLSATIFVG